MPGFSSTVLVQRVGADAATGSAPVTSSVLTQANVLAGTTLITKVGMWKDVAPPGAVSGITHSNVSTSTPVRLGFFEDGSGRCEIWSSLVLSDATANVATTVTFTAASTVVNFGVWAFSGFPTSWEISEQASFSRFTNATSHPCGTIASARANSLLLTFSVVSASRGTGTQNADYLGAAPDTRSWGQYRVNPTAGYSSNAQWTATNSRQVVSLHLALGEPVAVAPPTVYPPVRRTGFNSRLN